MPRARKTASGAPASPPRPAVGVPYGEGERRIESQRRTPVPAGPPPAPGGASGGSPGGSTSGPPGDPRLRFQAALAAAQKMSPGVPLTAPTQRPLEPIHVGMANGPGGGPEVLRTGDRVARTFRLLADVSGDARFAEWAETAAARGM